MKTAIIDYDAGNLANVVRAAERAGLSVEVTRNPEVIRSAKSLILPGVGAMKMPWSIWMATVCLALSGKK